MKNRTKRIWSATFMFVFLLIEIFQIFLATQNEVYAKTYSPKRVINVVYDDSGSMIQTADGVSVDTWCQAKYSMEVFAALLGDIDTMNIYVMSDFSSSSASAGPHLVLNGKDGASINVEKVHSMVTAAGNTPFNTVKKAYADLNLENADEKWLVVLTDGVFQGEKNINKFFAGKEEDIKVMFLGMGEQADSINEDPSNNIYFEKAETSNEILSKITKTCTRIFNTDKLSFDKSTNSFEFDIPMSEIVVFAQGENVQIGNLSDSSNNKISGVGKPVTVQYSEIATTDTLHGEFKVAENLKGQVLTFAGDFAPGEYSASVSGAETVEIYYKPNIEIAVFLTDLNGNEVTDMDTIGAGEYIMDFGFVKAGTRERINENSPLLGDVSYSATAYINGSSDGMTYMSGDRISLDQGDFKLNVTASYLKYNTTEATLDYIIYSSKSAEMNGDNSAQVYYIDETGVKNENEPMRLYVIDGETGLPSKYTKEEWAALPVPTAKRADGKDSDFEYRVEKSDTPGQVLLYTSLKKKKPGSKDYTGVEDVYLYSEYKTDYSAVTIEGTVAVTYEDTRDFWTKYKSVVGRSVAGFLFLVLLGGYVFKKRLPKKLKKMPTIDCKPNVVGQRRWQAHGKFRKELSSQLIPYRRERGTIRFLPGGVGGVPTMKVKAAGGHRIEIVNTKEYAGNKNFTIDGVTIPKDSKNLRKTAGMIIKYRTNEADYTCTTNK